MKAPHQLEFQALALLDAVLAGRPAADTGADTAHFATWPGPPRRSARLLAAYANAARGRDVLWLIGVKAGKSGHAAPTRPRVAGADLAHFEVWLHELLPFFDGLVPKVRAFTIPTGSGEASPGAPLVALQIETARAPFVVRTGARDATLEVPWWDESAGAIRSSGRQEMVKLLVPLQDLPQFEVLDAELTFYKNPHPASAAKTLHRWTLDGSLYVIPRPDSRAVIPLHRCSGSLHIPGSTFSAAAQDFSLTADKLSPGVRVTDGAVLIESLGRLFIYCCGSTTAVDIPWKSPLTATFDLVPAGAERAAVATASLRPEPLTESNQAGRWKL